MFDVSHFPEGPRREEATHATKPSKHDSVTHIKDSSGKVTGVASHWTKPDEAEIEGVHKGPSIRIRHMATSQSGEGRKLFHEIVKHAAKHNAGIHLSSLESSRPFYKKLGMSEASGSHYHLTPEQVKERASSQHGELDEHHKYLGYDPSTRSSDFLHKEYLSLTRHSMSGIHKNNATKAKNLLAKHLLSKGETHIPNIFGPIKIEHNEDSQHSELPYGHVAEDRAREIIEEKYGN